MDELHLDQFGLPSPGGQGRIGHYLTALVWSPALQAYNKELYQLTERIMEVAK